MGWLDIAAGAGEGLDKILERLLKEEQVRGSLKNDRRRITETERSNRADEEYRLRDLEETMRLRREMENQRVANQRDIDTRARRDDARSALSQLPMGTIMDPEEVESIIDLGAAMPERFEDATIPDRTAVNTGVPPALAQNEEVIKLRGTPSEVATQDSQRRADEREARLISQFDERERRMNSQFDERMARGFPPIIIQSGGGYEVTSGDRRTTTPLTNAAGQQRPLADPTAVRAQQGAMRRVAPLLQSIEELNEVLTQKPGIQALFEGGWEMLKAAAREDDDVAEYVRMIETFTPLWARAIGHQGVLTEQDVIHSGSILPKPYDPPSLRRRLMDRANFILGGGNNQQGDPFQGPTQLEQPRQTDPYQRYLDRQRTGGSGARPGSR